MILYSITTDDVFEIRRGGERRLILRSVIVLFSPFIAYSEVSCAFLHLSEEISSGKEVRKDLKEGSLSWQEDDKKIMKSANIVNVIWRVFFGIHCVTLVKARLKRNSH